MGRGQKLFKKISLYGTLVVIAIAVLLPVPRAEAQYDRTYGYYIETAQKAFEEKNYRKALIYFDSAHQVSPSTPRPKEHLFLIKYFIQGEQKESILREPPPEPKETGEVIPPPVIERPQKTTPKAGVESKRSQPVSQKPEAAGIPQTAAEEFPTYGAATAGSAETGETAQAPGPILPEAAPGPRIVIASETGERPANLNERYEKIEENLVPVIVLDDELWKLQPNTLLQIPINQSLIIEADNLRNFLVVDNNFLTAKQLTQNRIIVTAKRRGSTFLHIWDTKGRWTFHVSVVFPVSAAQKERMETPAPLEVPEDPFRFVYSNDWGGFYRGPDFSGLKRQTLTFSQTLGLYGNTPYGKFDSSMTYYKFDQSTEITRKSIGLTEGRIGPFKDFTIRGYDSFKRFSSLTLPGRSFRGFLLESYAFNHNLQYTYLRGKDRSTFLLITPGVFQEEKSYIEGARVTLFPEGRHSFSLNALRGFGADRPSFLKDRVLSVETKHNLDKLNVETEAAYDEDVWAGYINSSYQGNNNFDLRFNVRDNEAGFDTISGRPTDQGEAGVNLIADKEWEHADFSANIDLYRDREQDNPQDENTVNLDLATSFSKLFGESTRWNSSVYYTKTPQLLSPQDSLRFNNRLTRTFALSDFFQLNAFVGHSYQRSRFSNNPAADYNRNGMITGVSFPLAKYLSAFANYEYSWVEAKISGDKSNPRAFTSGFSYSGLLTPRTSIFGSFNYREEEDSTGDFSFLAGEDSIRGSLSLTYAPWTDWSVFADGQLQKSFPEDPTQADYWEADIRMGVNTSWDLPFRWNPAAEISGVVFKDLNGNGWKEKGESGIADVDVQVGKQIVRTDKNGEYYAKIRAKKVLAAVKLESLPAGFIASTKTARELEVKQGDIFIVDYGFSARTRIYGVVYDDQNGNGSPDAKEKTFVNVRMLLDDRKVAFTDQDGVYVFEGVTPGTHTISFDVNSLPKEYLPKVKIKNEVTVTEGTTYIFHIPLSKQP